MPSGPLPGRVTGGSPAAHATSVHAAAHVHDHHDRDGLGGRRVRSSGRRGPAHARISAQARQPAKGRAAPHRDRARPPRGPRTATKSLNRMAGRGRRTHHHTTPRRGASATGTRVQRTASLQDTCPADTMVSMPTFDYDAVIIGAGAAGLMAAIHAAERGPPRAPAGKGKKPGVKILMSGGTRCNITHDCDARGIVAAFGPNGKFLHSALAALGPRETVAFFEGEGRRDEGRGDGQGLPRQQPRGRRARRPAPSARSAAARRSPLSEPATRPRRFTRRAASASSPRRATLTCEKRAHHHRREVVPRLRHHRRRLRAAPRRSATRSSRRGRRSCRSPCKPPWVGELRGITLPDVNLKVLDATARLLDSRARVDAVRALRPDRPGPARREPGRQRPPAPDDADARNRPAAGEPEPAFDEFLRVEIGCATGKKQLAGVLADEARRGGCATSCLCCAGCPPTARPRR